ncbi:unnamed protein product [Rotaria sordida]|uniref:Uncharacterized protein n=1 Tax=Rotaria sordida TaxID=392033 RepID=A0A819D2E6_9BILA|nr:unnamed protein product [Rotaria sordida]CAF1012905.1 unnamed protein product [Rotaria sordida]CAF1028495.1 unnamed protein product [Rotaria sordida]CAF3827545.1 unnamed protein product [Rotaria sordida]
MPRALDEHFDLKFLAIGDSGVGKTCLLNQYIDEQFIKTLGTTVGIDIRDKNIFYKSNKTNKSYNISLQLWDTAGQERYRCLTTSFFRDAMGFLLVFDLTNETSFLNVRNWIGEIQSNAYSENVDMILVGNKCDLDNERIITKLRAIEFAQEYQVDYIETSALQNINVAESVELLLDLVMNRLEENENFSKKNSYLSKKPIEPINLGFMERNFRRKKDLSFCCNY